MPTIPTLRGYEPERLAPCNPAFSPQVAIHVLVDPRTDEVRYVGQTRQSLWQRRVAHYSGPGSPAKVSWLRELLAEGCPLVIGSVPTTEEPEAAQCRSALALGDRRRVGDVELGPVVGLFLVRILGTRHA